MPGPYCWSTSPLGLCLLLVTLVVAAVPTVCLAARAPALQVASSHLRGASDASLQLLARSSGVLVTQQHDAAADATNIEYSVDYSDEADAADPMYASDEAEDRALEQVMTFSTFFPSARQQQQQHGRPCHQQQHAASGMMPRPAAARAVRDAATAAAAAGAAEAELLVSAASQAWTHAQHVASRLAAADAAETAELITELENTMDRLAAAEAGAAASASAAAPFDRRWDVFDRGLFRGSALWSELVADVIDPLRRYVSGLDDYEPLGDDSYDSSSSSDGDELFAYPDGSVSGGEWEELSWDPLLLQQQQGQLPAEEPAPLPSDAADSMTWDSSEQFDIGQLLQPEENAANNLALFGVRTPAEVAAVAAAATAAGAQLEDAEESGPWSGMLDWLSAAPYLSPFDNMDPQKAAAVLLVGCTLMVFVAFLFSIVDLRNTVHTAAAAAAAAAAGSSGHGSSGGGYGSLPACAPRLRTRAYACSSAIAGTRSCAGPGAADELRRPLLVDVQDDLEAAAMPAQPSAVLGPAMQKFYNPLHYQALQDHA